MRIVMAALRGSSDGYSHQDESIADAPAHHMMVESFGLNHIVFVAIPRS
jgi:hypothetical protein